jgi:hypothetical protein
LSIERPKPSIGALHSRGVRRPVLAAVRSACAIALFACTSCGARTGLDVLPADGGTGSGPGEDGSGDGIGGSEEGGGAIGPCPVCPLDHDCTGPWACLASDGCTYGWCGSEGFGTNRSLCGNSSYVGWCGSSTQDFICADRNPEGPYVGQCVWPPSNGGTEDCLPSASKGQSCGRIQCGSGCTCLCENFCWCGD